MELAFRKDRSCIACSGRCAPLSLCMSNHAAFFPSHGWSSSLLLPLCPSGLPLHVPASLPCLHLLSVSVGSPSPVFLLLFLSGPHRLSGTLARGLLSHSLLSTSSSQLMDFPRLLPHPHPTPFRDLCSPPPCRAWSSQLKKLQTSLVEGNKSPCAPMACCLRRQQMEAWLAPGVRHQQLSFHRPLLATINISKEDAQGLQKAALIHPRVAACRWEASACVSE